MEIHRSGDRRQPKRTSNACEACRRSKVKCSGTQPCDVCRRRLQECCFVEAGRKVTVSASYLRKLQSQARGPRHESVSPPVNRADEAESGHPCDDEDMDADVDSEVTNKITSPPQINPDEVADCRENQLCFNPFTTPAVVLKLSRNMKRDWVYLAPTSTWSFHLRLTALIRSRLHSRPASDISFSLDGDAYRLTWQTSPSRYPRQPELSGIPPLNYATYLCDTVKFHLTQVFLLFDEHTFDIQLQEFYQDATEKVAQNRLWFIQFLLVLAFGTALLNSTVASNTDPPGASFFLHAMSLMPDMLNLWEDPRTSIEIFAMIALYLYSIDMRESAYLYVSQAVRIAIMEGMHMELPTDQIGLRECRCRNSLWWTVYILDQRITCSLGGPPTIGDDYITAPQGSPIESSPRDAALSLQAQVSRLTCNTLGAVQNARSGIGGTYLQRTAAVLRDLSSLSRELQRVIETKFKNSVNVLSKEVLHVVLSYHHCIILAVRPLLICVLEERLNKLDKPDGGSRSLSRPFETLIRTCLDSASTTLHILMPLMQSSQLEAFLPFDVDFTMSAGIVLMTANLLFPGMIKYRSFEEKVTRLLDAMASKGNRLAALRKEDLARLKADFELLLREEGSRSAPPAPEPPNVLAEEPDTQPPNMFVDTMEAAQVDPNQHPWLPSFDSGTMFDDSFFAPNGDSLFRSGLSPTAMSSIAHQLGQSGMMMVNGSDCLWETENSSM